MFISNRYLAECNADMVQAVEQCVERFEAAWRDGRRPILADFLPAGETERRATLLELVHADLEYRWKAGERAQAEEYLHQYPELREEQAAMTELIEAEFRLGRRGEAMRAATGSNRRLGQFELLEALGSGAFGTVYRARDTLLDRLVAVKVSRGSLDSREELDRFFRETRSAAALRHPGIVAIHEAGQKEGRCYLVSELVPGPTLAQRLAAGRPRFGEAAEIVAGVAEALHYAHQRGVIHRDIKPSNILLDAEGRPLLADFGLARRTNDNTLTVEGQVLGTPAYMPPEQAQGDAHRADARSDVYSLGVVLYELLTGVLPFQGHGSVVLRRIVEEEPLAPRRLDDSIPRDLETICLKALCKEPASRYHTAAELAEELRRFLCGEAIRTRPPDVVGRLARWCRRKPVVAGLLAALLLVTLVGFAGVSLAWRKAETHLAEARYQKERAERNYQEAHQVIGDLARLGSHPLLTQSPNVNPVRAELATTALKYYENYLERRADDPSLRVDVAEAYRYLGHLYAGAPENYDKAIIAFRKSLPLWRDLFRQNPEEFRFRRTLADTSFQLGNIYFKRGWNEEAIPLLKQACDLVPAVLPVELDNLGFLMDLAHSHWYLGSLQNDVAHVKAAECYFQHVHDRVVKLRRKEPDVRPYLSALAEACHQLGTMKHDRQDEAYGERWFEEERTLLTQLAKDNPGQIDLPYRFADNLVNIARAQDHSDRPAAALVSFRAAVLLWDALVLKRPTDEICLGIQATCYHKIGTLEWETGHPEAAVPTLQKALELRQRLCQLHPENRNVRSDQSGTWNRLGQVLEDLKRFSEAEQAYREALRYEQTVFVQQPGEAKVQSRLRDRYEALARVCQALGRTAEAEKIALEGKKLRLGNEQGRTDARPNR